MWQKVNSESIFFRKKWIVSQKGYHFRYKSDYLFTGIAAITHLTTGADKKSHLPLFHNTFVFNYLMRALTNAATATPTATPAATSLSTITTSW